jgi:hypothetical protein
MADNSSLHKRVANLRQEVRDEGILINADKKLADYAFIEKSDHI